MSTAFVLYAIRHKPTDAFMPMRWETWQQGYTHDEPAIGAVPRLFRTEKNAKQALHARLAGKTTARDPFNFRLKITPVEGRNADEMEIVRMTLAEAA